jgi:hypothetical protein
VLVLISCATQGAYRAHAEASRDQGRVGSAERAFYGLACSNFDGIWFNGWNTNTDLTDKPNCRQNRVARFRAGLDNLRDRIGTVVLEHLDVFHRETPTNTLVYAGEWRRARAIPP